MYLLWRGNPTNTLTIVVGLGLIGSSIVHEFQQTIRANDVVTKYNFPWLNSDQQEKTLDLILSNIKPHLYKAKTLHVIWAAGILGFECNEREAEKEFSNYETIIEWLEAIQGYYQAKIIVHLISSLGGLFEGAESINYHSLPKPVRAYGHLKLKQENRLVNGASLTSKIYRVSSAYGRISNRHRMGLIPTLIRNGFSNTQTLLTGGLETRRDYVWVGDVAKHIIYNLNDENLNQVQFIASFQSYSITQIVEKVESLLNIKLRLIIGENPTNACSILFCPSLRPIDLKISNIDQTMRYIVNSL